MTTPRDPRHPDLVAWGTTFTPAVVLPGVQFWQLILAAGPVDIGGNHHLYVDVLDKVGQRIMGVPVEFYSHDEKWLSMTEAKPGEPSAVNMPMYAGGNAYGVRIADGKPSDDLFGMGLGSFVPHHSFRLIFQLITADDGPVEPPPPSLDVREALEMVRFWADEAERRLPK